MEVENVDGGSHLLPLRAEWMTNLPSKFHSVPLHDLAIPGSHDSFSHCMEPGCEFGPDCPNMVKDLCKIVGSKAKTIVCKWSVTQSLSFKQQLDAGIRFFDLRVATNDASGPLDKVCFSHGLLCCTVEPCLREIAVFLNDHPKEVVLLDFSHFYKMSEALHNQLFQLLSSVFNGKLCPFVLNGEVQANVDLNTMWARRHQVIVFYQCKFASQHPELWPAPTIGTAWANTCDPNKLMSFLEQTYLRRQAGATTHIFYGFQGVLTPDFSFIMTHVIGNLKDTFAAEVSPRFVSWLKHKRAGPGGINIALMDFVEMCDFIPTVIGLNC